MTEWPAGSAARLHLLAGRPVADWRSPQGGGRVLSLHDPTGALLPLHEAHLARRLREGAIDLDEVDEARFLDALRGWRRTIWRSRVGEGLEWQATGDGEFPFCLALDGVPVTIRVNDFPAEPLYSVLADGQHVIDLEDWPAAWRKSQLPRRDSHQASAPSPAASTSDTAENPRSGTSSTPAPEP